jgi:hypothetical protein
LAKQPEQRPPLIRWITLKGLIALVVFLVATSLVEYGIVLYAFALGLQDNSLLQWTFQFPGTTWLVTLAISPMLHLVPICVIITLAFSWTYLTKKAATKRQEIRRGKVDTFQKQKIGKRGIFSRINRTAKDFSRRMRTGLSKTRVASYLSKVNFARATVKSAVFVLVSFTVFVFMFMVLAYPQLIYHAFSTAYRTNPGLLGFVRGVDDWARGVAQGVGPIGAIASFINNALISIGSGVRAAGLGLGELLGPVASLDAAGKFLVFENAGAWIAVFVVLLYGERLGKGYRYKK